MSRQPAIGNVPLLCRSILSEISRLLFGRIFFAKFYSVTFNGVVAAAVLASGFADAGSLAVSPLRLTFSPSSALGFITVENNGSEEALVQAETFAWNQTHGEHKLTATDDVVAMPPVFRLAAGRSAKYG